MSGLLKNKNIVVMGVANQRSISWGITKSLHEAGANLIFTNRSERSYKKLAQLLESNDIKASHITTCDVASDESIEHAFKDIHEHVGVIHGVFIQLPLPILKIYKVVTQTLLVMVIYSLKRLVHTLLLLLQEQLDLI